MRENLTGQEKIKATYWYLFGGMSQAQCAMVLCVNSGRINEAIKQVTGAVGLSDGGYKAGHEIAAMTQLTLAPTQEQESLMPRRDEVVIRSAT